MTVFILMSCREIAVVPDLWKREKKDISYGLEWRKVKVVYGKQQVELEAVDDLHDRG